MTEIIDVRDQDPIVVDKPPLGLPVGSIRAILALALGIGGFVVLSAMAFLFADQRDLIIGALITIVALVPNAYFKSREQGQNGG